MNMQYPPEHYVYTATGRIVHPATMTADDIDLGDIAHSLAGQNRYTGHSRISVARHSVCCYLVGKWLYLSDDALRWALLHDAAEAYFADIPRPLRHYLTPEYRRDYARLEQIIATKYHTTTDRPMVKVIDTVIVATEMRRSRLAITNESAAMSSPHYTTVNELCEIAYDEVQNWRDEDLFLETAKEVL